MIPEQARALFNEHREPGDLAHYGEKAAVAAIMAAVADSQDDFREALERIEKAHREWDPDSKYASSALADVCRIARIALTHSQVLA